MQKIKKIKAVSMAKIFGVMYGIIGLIIGAIITLMTATRMFVLSSNDAMAVLFFGLGAIVMLPVVYGAFGFLGGLIGAWIYNLTARLTGGLEIEIE